MGDGDLAGNTPVMRPKGNRLTFLATLITSKDRFDATWAATIPEPLTLRLDVKPGSCPNPLNVNSYLASQSKSKGKMAVALVAPDDFGVVNIDAATVQLSRAAGIGGSAAPLEGPPGSHTVIDDVVPPFKGETCDCHDMGGDGIDDLSMNFSRSALIEALELTDLDGGTMVELVATGNLIDGTEFTASDCIKLVGPGDLDGDNDVDGHDFITFSVCYNGSLRPIRPCIREQGRNSWPKTGLVASKIR